MIAFNPTDGTLPQAEVQPLSTDLGEHGNEQDDIRQCPDAPIRPSLRRHVARNSSVLT